MMVVVAVPPVSVWHLALPGPEGSDGPLDRRVVSHVSPVYGEVVGPKVVLRRLLVGVLLGPFSYV